MKKITTLLLSCIISYTGFSQTPITIHAGDIAVPGPVVEVEDIIKENIGNPLPGQNTPWDYSFYHGDSLTSIVYVPETDPVFVSKGIDVYTPTFKGLTPTLGYFLAAEIDFNQSGIYEAGISIPAAAFGLAAFTGNTNDSMIIPKQTLLHLPGKTILEYPATYGSAWKSSTRRYANFTLTVQAFGINHAPGQHVYTTVRSDTIVGWGTLRVYTPQGPSVPYEVLMDRVEEYNVDSFYLNGSPASPFLLGAFGVSQGQHTDLAYFYRFLRTGDGAFPYLANFFYDEDATYTTPQHAYINTENLSTGIGDIQDKQYATLLFPNPVSQDVINIQLLGDHPVVDNFKIFDTSGRMMLSGKTEGGQDLIQIHLHNTIGNGSYVVKLLDKSGKEIASERFNQAR